MLTKKKWKKTLLSNNIYDWDGFLSETKKNTNANVPWVSGNET